MDDYGIDDSYVVKIVAGVIIGLLVLFLVVPLAANMIATHNVDIAANNAMQDLNAVDTSLPASTGNILPTAAQADNLSTNMTNNTTQPNNSTNNPNNVNSQSNANSQPTVNSAPSTDGMKILSGTVTTGSSLSSKSVCKIYVGKEYAGAKIQMSTLYSRDGQDLNAGRLVPVTVDSSGYVTLTAADSYELYPDECLISIYDINGPQLDYKIVYLETVSGTQSF